jgi:hypothetical protein
MGNFECGPDPKDRDIVGYPAVLKQQQDYNGWLRSHHNSTDGPFNFGQIPETGELDKATLLSRFTMADGEVSALHDFYDWHCTHGTELLNAWVSMHYFEWRQDHRSEHDLATKNGICNDISITNDRFAELQRILFSIPPYMTAAADAAARARKLAEENYVDGAMPPELSTALAPVTAALRDDIRNATALSARAEKIEDAIQREIEENGSTWKKKFENDHAHDLSVAP